MCAHGFLGTQYQYQSSIALVWVEAITNSQPSSMNQNQYQRGLDESNPHQRDGRRCNPYAKSFIRPSFLKVDSKPIRRLRVVSEA